MTHAETVIQKTEADQIVSCPNCPFRGSQKELSKHYAGDGMPQCPLYAGSAFLSASRGVRPGDD